MDKVFLSLALIISGLTLGYVIQNLDRQEIVSLPISIVALRKTLQKMGLLFFMILFQAHVAALLFKQHWPLPFNV